MKKLFAILLVVMLFASMATVVSAAENTTTLTTTVPAATYTLNIPADQKIEYGATSTDIGFATISDATNFAVGKNVKVTITYNPFSCEGVSTTIPFTLTAFDSGYAQYSTNKLPINSGDSVIFKGKEDGTVAKESFIKSYTTSNSPPQTFYFYADDCHLEIASADWGKALSGTYTATITFTAEVVVEE